MNKTEVMKKLKAAGSESTRKTYARHGITGDAFGVHYADLYKLQQQIGSDQKLAEQLWATGNHDARILATLILEPAKMKASALEQWVKTVTSRITLDAVAVTAGKSPSAVSCMKKWIKSKQEWIAATGWHVLTVLANKSESLSEKEFASYIDHIEKNIHSSPNRVRHSMNQAVISIGVRNAALQERALAAATRIGKVKVDHGDTSCKTPDAAAYIKKTIAHRKKKGAKATAKKKIKA